MNAAHGGGNADCMTAPRNGAVTSAWAIEIVFGHSLPVGLQLADPGDVEDPDDLGGIIGVEGA